LDNFLLKDPTTTTPVWTADMNPHCLCRFSVG
uniref:Neur_chan_LBD domain-containing protein n=1 Tax=Haemonchus placei TaxID=6290 RepID=A0A0N4XAF8_HAEPC